MKTAVERNIMFGIVAVRTGAINIEQMEEGFRHWLDDKSKPLSEILKSQGLLNVEQSGVINSVLESELDPTGKSIAVSSVANDASMTATLQNFVADSDFKHFLDDLGDVNPIRETPSTNDDPNNPPTFGRYRILRPHAKGGLGEVFVARDEELDREVALKQIQPLGADNDELRDRFLREAEITGKLEHPGIVPVYGLGHHEDGRPYYAMRLIHGKSMREAIGQFHEQQESQSGTEQKKELRRLLGWFIDVCQAVAYAHSRSVLHRDLKPDNIMLGRYGETLIVDWGLARASEVDNSNSIANDEVPVKTQLNLGSSGTIDGTTMGTPAYMSPEQAQGQLDLLSPRSDIYSLGATLYSILTGSTPVRGSDVLDVLEKVKQGKVDPPRSVNASIPNPLEAICLKAMAFSPGDRYETPLDLAGDIEAWLADAPVAAWQEPFFVKARRWIKNHQPLVVGAVAAGLVALISSLVASAVLSSTNRELTAANALALEKTQIANEQSQLALTTMVEVIKDFQAVFEARSAPETITLESAAARRNMLRTALAGMRKVSSNLKTHTDYSDALVVAHMDLGHLFLTLGGEGFEDAREDAIQEYEVALKICEEWIAAEPDEAYAKLRYGQVHQAMTHQAHMMDNIDEAVRLASIAIRNSESLAEQFPEWKAVKLNLFHDYFAIGTAEFRRFNLDDSVAWYRRAIELVEQADAEESDFFEAYERDVLIPEIRKRITIFSNMPNVRDNIEFAFTLPEVLVPRILYDTAAWQAYLGDHETAFKFLLRMEDMELNPKDYYSNACGFARCTKALLDGRKVAELDANETVLAEKYNGLAMIALDQCRLGGLFDDLSYVAMIDRDPDLDVLRERDDFKKFWAELR